MIWAVSHRPCRPGRIVRGVAEGLGGELEIGDQRVAAREAGPEVVGIGVGGEHHVARAHVASVGCDAPAVAVPREAGGARARRDPRPGAQRGPRQPAHVAHRMDRARAPVIEPAGIAPAADHGARLLRAQHLHRGAEPPPFVVATLQPLKRRWRVGGVDRAVPRRFAADLMFLDQRKHVLGRGAEALDEAAAICGAEGRAHRRGRVPDTGIHETHVPARPAMADAFGFQYEAVEPRLRAVQRGRQAGEPAPHDGDIRRGIAVERCLDIRLDRRAVPVGNPFCRAHAPPPARRRFATRRRRWCTARTAGSICPRMPRAEITWRRAHVFAMAAAGRAA
jgi:hypothetical protein